MDKQQLIEEQQFQKQLEASVVRIEEILKRYLPEEAGYQKKVIQAMNYSIKSCGKRLRPMLMQETYRMFGGQAAEFIEPFMAAIEMIHTYSLVHDDLPAMDNDEYRRGRKTTHVVYGEGMGILAGDGLLNYAFETALHAFPMEQKLPAEMRTEMDEQQATADRVQTGRMQAFAKALRILAGKSGIYGMIGGQTADIEAEEQTQPITAQQLLFIHEHKTAALIQAAMMIGAVLAGASDLEIECVERCSYNNGVAFQIQDDILDVIGDSAELGKQVGSDDKNHKQTYVTVNGLEASKTDVARLSEEAIHIIDSFEGEHAFLRQLITTLIHRRK